MRLTVRLLALTLLLAIGTFAYFGSRTTMADDTDMVIEETESKNPGTCKGVEIPKEPSRSEVAHYEMILNVALVMIYDHSPVNNVS